MLARLPRGSAMLMRGALALASALPMITFSDVHHFATFSLPGCPR
jgi:hypothetical protein